MSSSSGKPSSAEHESLADKFRDSLSCEDKPDCKELNFRSPVSPLTSRQSGPAATSSSSSSSGSGRYVNQSIQKRSGNSKPTSHSGELSSSQSVGDNKSSRPPKHRRSDSTGSVQHLMSSSSANSQAINVLPTGNICPSGRIPTATMTPNRNNTTRRDVLGTGTLNYGHGSIMRGKDSTVMNRNAGSSSSSAAITGSEEMQMAGNDQYKKENFLEALHCYEKAIALSPTSAGRAALRSNKAAALSCLGRLVEAVRECEEALKLDPSYSRAYHRLSSLFIRLGLVENARRHFCSQRHKPNGDDLGRLNMIEKHMSRCVEARRICDWGQVLSEGDAAVSAGADASPHVCACRAEALLNLERLEEADSCLSNVWKLSTRGVSLQPRFLSMDVDAYLFFVRAEVDLSMGRFENAIAVSEKALEIDAMNSEVTERVKMIRLVARARSRGNDLFNSERFTEASSAYGEGLRIHPRCCVLYCNRAACWYKLGLWERSVEDCNRALRIQPDHTKSLLRRAASNAKLVRWSEAVRDYSAVVKELPEDNEIAESLFRAEVALKKSRSEEIYSMNFSGDVEQILSVEQFRTAVSSQGVSVVHFMSALNMQCKQIAPFLDTLCARYPSINFLKVDIQETPAVAESENVRIVPTFKIYKNSTRLKEMICPNSQLLEHSVRHYSLP